MRGEGKGREEWRGEMLHTPYRKFPSTPLVSIAVGLLGDYTSAAVSHHRC